MRSASFHLPTNRRLHTSAQDAAASAGSTRRGSHSGPTAGLPVATNKSPRRPRSAPQLSTPPGMDVILERMRMPTASEREHYLVRELDRLADPAIVRDFETAFRAASEISAKALRVMKADPVARPSGSAGTASDVEVRAERAIDFRPTRQPPSASMEHDPLEGPLHITSQQNDAIQAKLLDILHTRFPDKSATALSREAIVERPWNANDQAVWLENLNQQARLEQTVQRDFVGTRRTAAEFTQVLNDIPWLLHQRFVPFEQPGAPDDFIDNHDRHYFGDTIWHSMKARTLAVLAATVHPGGADFVPILMRLGQHAIGLADESERTAVVGLLVGRLQQFAENFADDASMSPFGASLAFDAIRTLFESSTVVESQDAVEALREAGRAPDFLVDRLASYGISVQLPAMDPEVIMSALKRLLDRTPSELGSTSAVKLEHLQSSKCVLRADVHAAMLRPYIAHMQLLFEHESKLGSVPPGTARSPDECHLLLDQIASICNAPWMEPYRARWPAAFSNTLDATIFGDQAPEPRLTRTLVAVARAIQPRDIGYASVMKKILDQMETLPHEENRSTVKNLMAPHLFPFSVTLSQLTTIEPSVAALGFDVNWALVQMQPTDWLAKPPMVELALANLQRLVDALAGRDKPPRQALLDDVRARYLNPSSSLR